MGNNSARERHGSSGTNLDTYGTPPTSPSTLISSTWSPSSQLVSISKTSSPAAPESPLESHSPPLITRSQTDLDCKEGLLKEVEKPKKTSSVPLPSGVCVKGDAEVDTKLLQECLNTLQLNESTHMVNDLLQCFLLERGKMEEELRMCTAKIQTEREEWLQFQADLKVALVVSDRLRAEAEEELNNLRSAQQDWNRQLADALQGRLDAEGQLESLKAELEQSRLKLKQVTDNHQGALRNAPIEKLDSVKNAGPTEGKVWTDELKGKREKCIPTSTERSCCRLSSDHTEVAVNGTSRPSISISAESTKSQGSLDQQNSTPSSIKERKSENSLQTSTSSALDVQSKINRISIRTQEDSSSGLRSLRLHGSSRRNSLLHWCQSRTQGYKNVEITNFSSCWVDGLAFCAVYHSFLPSHIPYEKLTPENKKENLTLAFRIGESFGISTLLTVEEMLKDDAPDWHRVLEYVESIYRHFEM